MQIASHWKTKQIQLSSLKQTVQIRQIYQTLAFEKSGRVMLLKSNFKKALKISFQTCSEIGSP